MKTLFTAHAKTKGGRNGHSQTTDGKLSFELAMPGSKKTGTTTNPEELFACGYSACFGSALEYVAGLQKLSVADAEVNADVSLNQGDTGFSLSVVLNVSIPSLDQASAIKLVEAAHQVCPYSKATRGNIEVSLQANGAPVAKAA
ncbi:MAG: organic hydroperoxide resistance protein [Proteobacteria bacterium]|nr:organic hydroperoxide resistance protein [Pseudomonadota bacterium]